jgi:hypothetical protein
MFMMTQKAEDKLPNVGRNDLLQPERFILSDILREIQNRDMIRATKNNYFPSFSGMQR